MRVRRGNSLTSGADTLMIPRCPRALEVFLLLTILIPLRSVWAFPITLCAPIVPFSNCGGLVFFTPSSSLYSSNPPRRKARRSLPKRRRKKSKTGVEFVGTRKWSDVVKGSSGPTNDPNYVGTTPIDSKYTNSQNSPLKADRKTTIEQ